MSPRVMDGEHRTAVSCRVYGVYSARVDSAALIAKLQKAGWELCNVRGSHHVYRHSERPGHISVPHPQKDLGRGLLHKLMKQAGLKR